MKQNHQANNGSIYQSTIAIGNVHTVPQRTLDCRLGLDGLNQVYGPNCLTRKHQLCGFLSTISYYIWFWILSVHCILLAKPTYRRTHRNCKLFHMIWCGLQLINFRHPLPSKQGVTTVQTVLHPLPQKDFFIYPNTGMYNLICSALRIVILRNLTLVELQIYEWELSDQLFHDCGICFT